MFGVMATIEYLGAAAGHRDRDEGLARVTDIKGDRQYRKHQWNKIMEIERKMRRK